MDLFRASQPDRTFLILLVADSDHQVETLPAELLHALGFTPEFDSNFLQDLYGFRVDITRGFRPRGKCPPLRVAGIYDRLAHLRPAGVPRPKEHHSPNPSLSFLQPTFPLP